MPSEALPQELAACDSSTTSRFACLHTAETTLLRRLEKGAAVSNSFCSGIDQGCPSRAVALVLGLQRARESAKLRLIALRRGRLCEHRPRCYIDAIVVHATQVVAAFVLRTLAEELPRVGLQRNLDKCACVGPDPDCNADPAIHHI